MGLVINQLLDPNYGSEENVTAKVTNVYRTNELEIEYLPNNGCMFVIDIPRFIRVDDTDEDADTLTIEHMKCFIPDNLLRAVLNFYVDDDEEN